MNHAVKDYAFKLEALLRARRMIRSTMPMGEPTIQSELTRILRALEGIEDDLQRLDVILARGKQRETQ